MTNMGRERDTLDRVLRRLGLLERVNRESAGAWKYEAMYYQMLAKYFTRLFKAREEGNFVAAHSVFLPVEILYSMDIVPLHTQWTTWLMSILIAEYADVLSAGEDLGLATEICSAERGVAGAFSLGVLPRPDVVLWSNFFCPNIAKDGELLMKINHCPGFFLDHPFQDGADERKYLVGELEDMVRFLEEQSDRRMDWGRLAEVVAEVDKQISLLRQISELRKAVPCPFPLHVFMQQLTVRELFSGQPEATEYLEALRQELSRAVEAGEGAASPERFRLMSLFLAPVSRLGFLERISREHGAVSVIEPFFSCWDEGRLDSAEPVENLARKIYLAPEMGWGGPWDDRALKRIADYAEQYKADGAIYYAHLGCGHSCAMIKLIKDTLNEVDVPLLILDCDVIDPRVTSKLEIREKLEQFFELLEDR